MAKHSTSKLIATALAALLTLQACSSRPRDFAPALSAAAPSHQQGLEAAFDACRRLASEGKLDSSGRLASAGAGAAASATTAVAGTAVATTASGWSGWAVMGATVLALPVVAIGGAWGLAKAKKNRKEKAIQQMMTGCLEEHGYWVEGWVPVPRRSALAIQAPPAEGADQP